MQIIFTTLAFCFIAIEISRAFTLPKGLSFLGCLFKCPSFNESIILFPEVAAKSRIPNHVQDKVRFCKNKTRTNDKVFGICDKICFTGNSLDLFISKQQLSKFHYKNCTGNVKIYSLVGDLYDYHKRLPSTKRAFIATPMTKGPEKYSSLPKNLFFNNDFELEYKVTKAMLYWSCQGDTDDFIGMNRDTYKPVHGTYCGICKNRKNDQEGPGQHIGDVMTNDGIFKVQGWTRLMNTKTMEELASIELWIRWQSKESSQEVTRLLARRNKIVRNNGWVYWNTQFHIPANDNEYKYIFIYFKGPPKHVDIDIDSMVLTYMSHDQNWKALNDAQIDKIRKRDTTIRVAFDKYQYSTEDLMKTKLEVRQISNGFGFGAAVHYDALKNNEDYRNFIKQHFEWATMESSLKWENMAKKKGETEYQKVDEMLAILNDLGLSVRGHCIFWESQNHVPAWLSMLSKEDLRIEMRTRLLSVVLKYKDKFKHWDVNNEMLQDSYFTDKLGSSVRKWMYSGTHQLDPSAKLFANELDVLSAPFLLESYVDLITEFKESDVPLHGIGVQGHFADAAHPEIIKERIDILARAGLPIWITEFDIKEEDEERRADILETVLRVAYAHPHVDGVILWSFWDKHSWRGSNTCLFEGDNFQPNKVGERYQSLRQQWNTPNLLLSPTEVVENKCDFKFRTFHGKYSIKIIFPDGKIIEKIIDVANHAKPLMVEFKAHVHSNTQ